MAKLKAILVTKGNQGALESQYDLEPGMLEGRDGLYLIADFGESTGVHHGWVNRETLEHAYIITGVKLRNDYFEIERKQ